MDEKIEQIGLLIYGYQTTHNGSNPEGVLMSYITYAAIVNVNDLKYIYPPTELGKPWKVLGVPIYRSPDIEPNKFKLII